METVLACGFNGFSQITSLASSLQTASTLVSKEPCKGKYPFPIEVCKLPHHTAVHHVLFTWDKIAITHANTDQQKQGTAFVTYVSGFSPVCVENDPNKDYVVGCEGYEDTTLTASSDTDIVMTNAQDSNQKYLLQEDRGKLLLCPFLKGLSSNVDMKLICGGHKDFFFTYEDINFGKMCLSEGNVLESSEGTRSPFVSIPINPIDSSVRICAVSCGKEHVMLLSHHGSIYTYGLGSRGQLGHSTVESETSPRLVEALEGVPVTCIAAGGWHSAAISESGDLYTWGWNESGQLGLTSQSKSSDDNAVGIQAEPTVSNIPSDITVTSVACGSRHTLCLTVDGHVLSCGWNEYGQLGHGHLQSLDKFTEVQTISCVQKIFAGQWNSVFTVGASHSNMDSEHSSE